MTLSFHRHDRSSMFSFFKKKPASAPSPDRAADSRPQSTGEAEAPASAERQRGKLDWLNADVGELFFGKKAAAPAPAAAAVPSRPAPAVPAQAPPSVPPVAPAVVSPASAPAPVDEPAADRAGWMTKLKSGLQRTGGAIA